MNILEAIQIHFHGLGSPTDHAAAIGIIDRLREDWRMLAPDELQATALATRDLLDRMGIQAPPSPDLTAVTRDIARSSK